MTDMKKMTLPSIIVAIVLGAAALTVGIVAMVSDSDGEEPSKADPINYTIAFVEKAVDYYRTHGRQATLDYYNSPESADGRWYLFVIDAAADELVVHPNSSLLGAKSSQRRDSKGYAYGAEMLKTTDEGQWVSYYYRTYDGDTPLEEGQKHTWLVLHDGMLFGSGWYEAVSYTHLTLPTKRIV